MNSTEAIEAAFMGLCAQKPYEAITVKELCERAPVARTTFYAHYRNIADVRQEIEDSLIDGLMGVIASVSEGDLATVDFADVLDAIFGFVRENQDWTRSSSSRSPAAVSSGNGRTPSRATLRFGIPRRADMRAGTSFRRWLHRQPSVPIPIS